MIKNKKILLALLFIVMYSVISGLLIILVNGNLYCAFYLIQNLLIPIIATRFLIKDFKLFYRSSSKAIGPLIGVSSSLLPNTLMVFVPIVLVYFNGEERSDLSSQLAFATIAFSGIVAWLGLILLSSLAGLLTATRYSKNNDNLQGHDP